MIDKTCEQKARSLFEEQNSDQVIHFCWVRVARRKLHLRIARSPNGIQARRSAFGFATWPGKKSDRLCILPCMGTLLTCAPETTTNQSMIP